jgi:diguanylate cyclase (GGDEF)-like protein
MADLDDFKSINDQYGHLIGDQALVRAAAILGSQLRKYDLVARFGGEEFVLLLPRTSIEAALVIAERIRKDVSEVEVPGCGRGISASLGVAGWRTGETPDEFVASADAALYHAKRTGRNRVEAAPGVAA